MTLLTDEERAKLVELEKAATPGPWRAAAPKGRVSDYTSIVEGADGRMALFAGAPSRSDEEIVANCALTVATRNALPALLAADAAVRGMRAKAFDQFHNALRILTSLDKHELIEAGVIDHSESDHSKWIAFRDDPFRWFIRADDESATKLWGLIERRQRR